MMNLNLAQLKELAAIEGEVCISIYLPTARAGATVDQARIRFKNLLRRAEHTAAAHCGSRGDLGSMIRVGWRLMDDTRFWRRRSDGLAVFLAPQVFLFYRVPLHVEERFAAAGRFLIKPLIPLFMAAGRFSVLALSLSRVRLLACTRHSVMEVDTPEVPDGIDRALQYDSKQTQLQYQTGAAAGGGDRPALFHGHGVGVDDRKDEIRRYFQNVDRGLGPYLPEPEAPLVLAGVEYLLPIFREVTSARWVLDASITGNPDTRRAEVLHAEALEIVRPVLDKRQHEDAARYRALAGKGFTAAGVRAVVPAAAAGRVDTLFVALDRTLPGLFDRTSGRVRVAPAADETDPTTEDLLNRAAVETLLHGGRVYARQDDQLPDERDAVAAILRY